MEQLLKDEVKIPVSSAQRWYTYPVVTFILDQYWTNNYRQRSWYQQRERFRSYTRDNNRYRYERSNDRNRYRNRDRDRDDRYYNDRFQRDRWGRGDRDNNNRTWQTRPTIEVKKPRVVTRPVVKARPRVVVPVTTRQTLETKKRARVRSYEEKRRVRGETTTDQDQQDD